MGALSPVNHRGTYYSLEGFQHIGIFQPFEVKLESSVFWLRILCEKYLQHQQDLYHVFIVFKKAFGQGLACSFVGNHEKVQHQHKPYPGHQKPL